MDSPRQRSVPSGSPYWNKNFNQVTTYTTQCCVQLKKDPSLHSTAPILHSTIQQTIRYPMAYPNQSGNVRQCCTHLVDLFVRGERLQDKSEEQNSKPYIYTNRAHANYCILLTMSTFATTMCITQLIICPPSHPPPSTGTHPTHRERSRRVCGPCGITRGCQGHDRPPSSSVSHLRPANVQP